MRLGSSHFRQTITRAILPVCLILSGGCGCAVGQTLSSASYRIKPSEVALPQGVVPGQYRRMIQPFPNWTLICDENLKKKQRTCNITQTIVDGSGALAFSWSLAATSSGQPLMIVRVPAEVGAGGTVAIGFADGKNTVNAKTENCDQNVCLALVPIGPALRKQINSQSDTQVTYASPRQQDGKVVINTTFKGLPTALAAIK
ncbi:MAG: invasion associated locus B family protein [Rhizobiaceae bacterium]|nr:invasion associated locus B family protein [Rhizobiaceae bacterium]